MPKVSVTEHVSSEHKSTVEKQAAVGRLFECASYFLVPPPVAGDNVRARGGSIYMGCWRVTATRTPGESQPLAEDVPLSSEYPHRQYTVVGDGRGTPRLRVETNLVPAELKNCVRACR